MAGKKGRLEEVLGRLWGRRERPPTGEGAHPCTPFEAALEQRIRALEQSVAEVKGRVNGLLFLVAGAVLVQLILGFLR